MKIAIDTLFERSDSKASSAVDYLLNLAAYLPEAGPQHEYFLLVGRKSAYRYKHLERNNLRLIDCFFANDHRALRMLAQQTIVPFRMKQLKIDVLFAAGNVCPLVGDFCRVLKINTLHHYSAPQMLGRAKSTYRRAAFSVSARNADSILANSSATHDDICNLMQVDPGKVKIVWEAVDDRFAPATERERQLVCERFNLHRPFVLFSSNLWPYKNPHTLIRAYSKLVRRHDIKIDLVLAGRTDEVSYRAQLDAIVREEGLSGRVHFLGMVPNREMPAIYSSAIMLVYPSLSETFGKPLLEAMRCDLPIVASNASCIPEILGGAGLLVNPDNEGEIADTIYRVLTNDDLRTDLVERGRKRSLFFSWKESARQTLQVIESTYDAWQLSRRPVAEIIPNK